jgi:hypothetical protein
MGQELLPNRVAMGGQARKRYIARIVEERAGRAQAVASCA